MGNSEDGKSSKPEKSPSSAGEQSNVHVYPDWAAMQAYYGPRMAMPPYMNSAVASGHPPPPFMWGPPQSMMPYGSPYAAFYPHAGVYAHPGVPMAGTSLSMETPAKSAEKTEGNLVKKLKEFDGLAMSIGNGNADSSEGGAEQRSSQSGGETDGSSDGSNGVTAAAGGHNQNGKKRSRGGSPHNASGAGQGSEKAMDMVVHPASITDTALASGQSSLDSKDLSTPGMKQPVPATVLHSHMASETWLQNERELKRERRKQSNRESARRSRLRKQAEAEELALKVQALTAENMTLKSEINKLIDNSDKLKVENATLMEKLKDAKLGQTEDRSLDKIDDLRLKPVGTADLLARVDSSNANDEENEETDAYENKRPRTKLRQLLDSSPRTDPVAAG